MFQFISSLTNICMPPRTPAQTIQQQLAAAQQENAALKHENVTLKSELDKTSPKVCTMCNYRAATPNHPDNMCVDCRRNIKAAAEKLSPENWQRIYTLRMQAQASEAAAVRNEKIVNQVKRTVQATKRGREFDGAEQLLDKHVEKAEKMLRSRNLLPAHATTDTSPVKKEPTQSTSVIDLTVSNDAGKITVSSAKRTVKIGNDDSDSSDNDRSDSDSSDEDYNNNPANNNNNNNNNQSNNQSNTNNNGNKNDDDDEEEDEEQSE